MIVQDPGHPRRVLAELARLVSDPEVTRLRVAVAYANARGVHALQKILAALPEPVQVDVVVTLDMGITRKAALEALLHDFDGDGRAIVTPAGPGTFHAKAFVVDRDGASQRALVGSANLTDAALTHNHEAVAVVDLTERQTEAWETWWAELVTAADELTEELIAGYVERKPPAGHRERIADEETETGEDGSTVTHKDPNIDARDADWLVIDWGGTGEYRVQSEFPKAAAAFFRPDLETHRHVTIRHDGQDFEGNELAYYPNNGMVRINLDPDIPVVADGSIKEGASLFRRLASDHYELEVIDAADRAGRLAAAAITGGTDHTVRGDDTWREFGWT